MLRLELRQALERAEREGRAEDAQQIRFLLSELEDAPEPEDRTEEYMVQEGEDPFGIAEDLLGSLEFLPDFLAENPNIAGMKAGTYVRLPAVGRLAKPEPKKPDAGALVDLFETIGPAGENWTAEEMALLESFQPANPADPSEETTVKATQAEGATRKKEQGSAAPPVHGTGSPDEEDYTPEEMAEAQEVLDALMAMGMPDPGEWQGGRLKKGQIGPPPPPTPTPGNGEAEEENWFLEFVDWLRDRILEAFGYGEPSATPTLPPPEVFTTRSTPTETATPEPSLSAIQHTVESGETILGLVSNYGVSLDNLEAANPLLASRLEEGQSLLQLVYSSEGAAGDLLLVDDILIIPMGLANDFDSTSTIQSYIKQEEGFVPFPYDDPAGNCSVAHGHLIHYGKCDGRAEESQFQNITPERAEDLFQSDLYATEQAVKAAVNVKLNQNQFDALVSFVYNVGAGNFLESDLLGYLNDEDFSRVPEEIERFVYGSDEKEYAGLEERRQFEADLFSGEINE